MQEVEHKEGELHKIGMPRSEAILMPKRLRQQVMTMELWCKKFDWCNRLVDYLKKLGNAQDEQTFTARYHDR